MWLVRTVPYARINTATAVMYTFHNPHGYPRKMATGCVKRGGGAYAYTRYAFALGRMVLWEKGGREQQTFTPKCLWQSSSAKDAGPRSWARTEGQGC